MRNEDASGSFSAVTGNPDARDDADALPAGSHGPATGNTITGAGTITGLAGADLVSDGSGKIVALEGAGGSATGEGGSLHVGGRFGDLTMDTHGNYSYRPNAGVQGVQDVFRYTLADDAGARDAATLTIEIGREPQKIDANAQQIIPGPDGVVTLPPGVELSDVHVVGRNLVIDMPDGTQMIIVDGAVFVPQLVLNGVEVPATNLAALLVDSEPQPAGGIPQSSGGNFDVPVPPLDPGVPLGDLIPPTELVFTPPEFHDIGQFIDRKPEAGAVSLQLDDDDVPGKNGNPGGTNDDSGLPNATGSGNLPGSGGDGTLTWDLLTAGAPAGFSYVDGPNGSILVQQVQGAVTVTVLTITINPATGAYSVTENSPILHATGDNENNAIFTIGYTVTDSDGDVAPGTITINVDDDTPTVSVVAGSDANVILTTHDAATIGVNSEAVSTTANFSGVFSGTTVSFGADGAGVGTSSGYALSTTGGASGLTQHGVAINLYNVGGVIVGSTATTAAGIDASNTVFTVSTTNTGIVTLTQFSQIDHTNTDPSPTGAPFTDQFISLTDGSITLTRNETVVDKDGDSVTGSAAVGIGANLHFVDDGPTISLADRGEPSLTVDETNLGINDTQNFAANFGASFGADGPAPGTGSITYALGINPGASGLTDTLSGEAVVLLVTNGVVEGRTATTNQLVFTVSVAANGDVTLDQIRAVIHGTASNPDTSEDKSLAADNLVTLTATAHDFDGDTASATINIGQNLHFLDDGPTAAIGTTGQTVSLDETPGVQGDSNDVAGPLAVFGGVANKGVDPDMATQFAANANPIVNSTGTMFGADGGTAAFSLNVSSAGVDSGLNTTDGHDILLFKEGDLIVGRVSGGADDGKAAFAISIDSTGHISMVEWLSIQHPNTGNPDDSVSIANGAILAVVTATDGDGDTSTASTAIGGLISFQDDGPTAAIGTTQQTVSLDETVGVQGDSNDVAGPLAVFAAVANKGVDPDMVAQFAANANAIVNSTGTVFGADGPGTAAFSLNVSSAGVDSGLNTTDGHDILLFKEGDLIVGRVSGGADDGKAAFAIAIDSSGHISMVEWLSIQHPNTGNPDDSVSIANGAILAVVTATDGDGDSSTASTAIGGLISFQDDGPTIDVTKGSDSAILVTTHDALTIGVATDTSSASFAGVFGLTSSGGSDGAANIPSLSYVLGVPGAGPSGVDSGLDQAGANIYLYTIGGKVVGSTSATLAGVNSGNTVFDVSVVASGVNAGTVTLTQYSQIDHPIAGDPTPTVAPFADHIIGLVDSLVTLTANSSITDGDGDTATDSETIGIGANLRFADDGPIATNDTDTIVGGNGPATGNVITGIDIIGGDTNLTDGSADSIGADTPGTITRIVSVNNANVDTSYDGSGNLVVVGQYGTLTINANGNYSYLRTAPDGGVSDVFTYTLTDRDGDTATATLTIGIQDNFPSAGTINVLLDDDALLGGNPGTPAVGDDTPDTQNTSGSLIGTGGDGPLTFSFSGAGAPAGFTYDTTTPGVLLIKQGSVTVITVTITNATTGTYTVVQNAPILHATQDGIIGLDNTENNQTFAITYNVTDSDGDVATPAGTININVDDDTPTIDVTKGAEAGVVLLTHDALTIGAATDTAASTANFSGVFGLTQSAGADGTNSPATLSFALDVTGFTGGPAGIDSGLDQGGANIYLYEIGGKVVGSTSATLAGVTAGNTVFDVAVSGTGVVTLSQYSQIDHPIASDPTPTGTPYADHIVSLVDSLVTLTASATLTDKDGDTVTDSEVVNIGANLQFADDGPTAGISAAGFSVSIDESVGNQIDSKDVTGPLAAFAGVANPGDDPDVAGTGAIQYATSTSAILSTGTTFGADGGTAVFSLNVSVAGVDSGLNTTAGADIFLYKEGNLIVGRVGSQAGPAAFALSIDPVTGIVSMVEYLSIQHNLNGLDPDDSVSIANGAVLAVVTATDGDGDTSTASAPIGSLISFQDSGPVMTSAENINIQNSGDVAHTGAFLFNLGADGANATNDVISIGASSVTVNGVAVTNYVLTPGVENATTASYTFSFDYPNGTGTTAHETGTLVFDKAAGTYTVDLADPISGFSILATGNASAGAFTSFQSAANPSGSPEIAVAALSTNFFVQFTGAAEPGAGTGANNLFTTQGASGAFDPSVTTNFNNLDLFTQAETSVSISSSAAGVAGNTIQGGEVLDFNLYNTNPGATTGGVPTASSPSMFLTFDGIGATEDMIIILKLYDPTTGDYTTRALMVQNTDIQKGPGNGPGAYSGIVLDNNDGMIVIESNDYNAVGEHWVIVGAQILGSDEGVTGTAINFNNAIGAGGASTGTQAFTTDVDDGPFKITSIGFLTTTTTNQVAHLSFDVTVQDGDNDTITQTIVADVTAAVDSASAATIPAANTTVAPVVIDLNGDGVHFLATDAGVHYDYGSGSVATAWVSPQDGILVRDANGSGTVDSSSEFVFGGNGLTDLQGLAAQYGATLDANDADFAKFAIWQDANSNGVADAGELVSLTAAGITSISLTSDGIAYEAANGDVTVAGTGSYTKADGSTGALADAIFQTGSGPTSDLRLMTAANNNSVLLGAIAAAGLGSTAAAASVEYAPAGNIAAFAVVAAAGNGGQAQGPAEEANDVARAALTGEAREAVQEQLQAGPASHTAEEAVGNTLTAGDNHELQAPAPLLDGTDSDQSAPAQSSFTSGAIGMPSAEMLAAANDSALEGQAKTNGEVGRVLLDALAGGGYGPNIDAVINAAANQNHGDGQTALEAIASHGPAAVSGWDMANIAGFTGAHGGFTADHMTFHVDAPHAA